MDKDNPFAKSKTIDPEVRAHVYSLVNALGGTSADDDGHYVLGDDATAVLRDLKRWLKLYDEKMNRLDVARCLAEANLVRGDLLPIISLWSDDGKNEKLRSRVALACLELLVPLTWPLEQDEMTVNHYRHQPHIQQAQVKYKAACMHWEQTQILRQAIRAILPSLALDRDSRSTRDEGIIKLVLYLIRNTASIRQLPDLPSQGLENETSRSTTIDVFQEQDVFALLLTMCSNIGDDFGLQDVILLEIIFNLIKGVEVERLWMQEEQIQSKNMSDLRTVVLLEKEMHKGAQKTAWSRHGKFGTMIWVKGEEKQNRAVSGQDNIKDSATARFNMDNTKKWSKPAQRRRDLDLDDQNFDLREDLTSSASKTLRLFAEEFLDSSFNPLVSSLRKAIEREAERLLPPNYRQFFYVVSWFLKAERIRRQAHKSRQTSSEPQSESDGFSLVAAVLNQETFIMLNRYMQISHDEKQWQDLNASMRCFTEILLTVQEMAASPAEEDQEIAENIQNRIFYEETTHDRVRLILSSYKDQGLSYLDACTELSHVFLKMLERYSKENHDLQTRTKRTARRKKKDVQLPTAEAQDADAESENEDRIDAVQISRERKFDFERFASRFVSQGSIDTFMTLLRFYKDLNPEQLKRVHRFLHRAAFKQDMAILLYRVDNIALLYRMVDGPEALPKKHPSYNEWQELVKHLLRKMFKKLGDRPELAVEMLFSKIPSTLYYLEHGHDRQLAPTSRPPAELEIKTSVATDRAEQIGIVIAVLLKDAKDDLVNWIKINTSKAFDERHSWEAEAAARNEDAVAVLPSAEPILLRPGGLEVRIALFKNARFRLLCKLVGFECRDAVSTPESVWELPSSVTSDHLRLSRDALDKYVLTPWQSPNPEEDPEDAIRRAARQPANYQHGDDLPQEAPRDNFVDDSEGEENPDFGEEEFLFPDNLRSKRRDLIDELKKKRSSKKRKHSSDVDEEEGLDEVELQARRRRREENALERRRKIKSQLYVMDSEDDEDADRAFFEREAQLRKEQDANIRKQMRLSEQSERLKKKTTTGEKARFADDDSVLEDMASSPPLVQDLESSENELDPEETPPSSPPKDGGQQPLKELPQARADHHRSVTKKSDTEMIGDQIGNDVSHRRRGGFVVLDDEDDE